MGDGLPDIELQRVVVVEVGVYAGAALPAMRQHAGMLARAIVVQLRELRSWRRRLVA
jgi:hypothetical protein